LLVGFTLLQVGSIGSMAAGTDKALASGIDKISSFIHTHRYGLVQSCRVRLCSFSIAQQYCLLMDHLDWVRKEGLRWRA